MREKEMRKHDYFLVISHDMRSEKRDKRPWELWFHRPEGKPQTRPNPMGHHLRLELAVQTVPPTQTLRSNAEKFQSFLSNLMQV